MSTVTVSLPPTALVKSGLGKVTLSANNVTLTLPITDPKVDFGELAPNWVSVARPGLVAPPYTVRGPRPLHTVDLTVTLVNPNDALADIEGLLGELFDITQADQITLSYGSFESSSRITTNQFVCTSFKPTITVRDPASNRAIQGTATLTLQESNPPPVFTG